MKKVNISVMALLLLTAFAPMQSAALASYSNDEGSHSKKESNEHPSEHPAEGSHSNHVHADTLNQAAKELKATNPELAKKLEKIAAKFNS